MQLVIKDLNCYSIEVGNVKCVHYDGVSFILSDDGSGKWPYGGSIEAAKSMGAKTVEKVRRLFVFCH